MEESCGDEKNDRVEFLWYPVVVKESKRGPAVCDHPMDPFCAVHQANRGWEREQTIKQRQNDGLTTQKSNTTPPATVARAPDEPAIFLIPCLFFCISFYRWWTSIIFITRRTNCWARPVNNSWASRWRRSSKRSCRRLKDTCEQS